MRDLLYYRVEGLPEVISCCLIEELLNAKLGDIELPVIHIIRKRYVYKKDVLKWLHNQK